MKQIKADIQSGKFQPVYLLYGEEAFLLNSYKRQLQEAIIGDDQMNLQTYEGRELSLTAVQDFAQTMPFFAERKLIVLSNTGLFKNSNEDWAAFIETLPEFCHIIFSEETIDKRNRLYKAVSKKGYVAEFRHPGEREILGWITGYGRHLGKKVEQEAAFTLFLQVGNDLYAVKNELEKVIGYVGDRDTILQEDVEKICTPQLTNRIFSMIDHMAEGRTGEALAMYYDLLALKEPSMRILYLIGRHLNILWRTRELSGKHVSKEEIAERTGVPSRMVWKYLQQAKTFTQAQLKESLTWVVEAEEGVKTGKMADRLAVETVLVRMSKRMFSKENRA